MTCASCVNRIERFLGRIEGVAEANVNLATERATVRFDPAPADGGVNAHSVRITPVHRIRRRCKAA